MIKKWEVTLPELSGDEPRRAYLYLPDMYDQEPNRRFPVLYMFDGHNVFFDSDATYGKSWQLASYLQWHHVPLIVAAVECNHTGKRRLEEYCPFDCRMPRFGEIEGQGERYMEWLVNTFKPMIDKRVRTLRDREHTLIAGSSMGGLMALYGATAYNHVFQRAACLSPSLWIAPGKVAEMLQSAPIADDTCIYMDYGSLEMGNHRANATVLRKTVDALLKKRVNLTFRIVPGGSHNEASWEKQIPVFLSCLGF